MFAPMDNTEPDMNVNVGSVDRAVRIAVGLGLIALAVMGVIGVWGYIGVVPLLTGIVRVCPAYSLLGIDTCGQSTRSGMDASALR